jgi:hypothetical protein
MKECKVTVAAGVCKMNTIIIAQGDEETGMVVLNVTSDCPNVLKMAWGLKPICPYTEVDAEMNKTEVYKLASEALPHAACPVPCGMMKAVEVAGGLGLKRDVTIKVE